MVGSEGTLGVVVEAKIALVPLPKAKAVLAIQFDDLLEALEATPAILAHEPSAVEVMDGFILDHTKQSPALDRLRRTFIEGDPGGAAVRRVLRRARTKICRRGSTRSSAISRRADSATATIARSTRRRRARSGSLREAALGLSMAMKGDAKSLSFVEDTAVAPERLRDYIDGSSQIDPQARHDGRRLRARVGRLPARAAGRQPEDRGGRPAVRGDRHRQRRPGARVRRRAVGRTRRRPGPQPASWRRCSARRSTRRSATSSRRSIRTASSIPARSSTRRRSPRTCATAPATARSSRRRSSTTPSTAAWPARSRCAAASAPAARRSTGRCARRTWRRGKRRTRRAGARTSLRLAMAGTHRRSGPRRRGRARGARPVPRVPRLQGRVSRSAWTSRGSRASSSPTTGAATARRSARTCSDTSTACRGGAAGSRRCRTRSPAARRCAGSTSGCSGSIGAACRRHGRRGPSHGGFTSIAGGRALAPAAALFNDTFTNYYSPEIGVAGLQVLEIAGLDVELAPTRVLRPAADFAGSARRRRGARRPRNVDRLYPLAERGVADRVLRAELSVGDREDVPALLRGDAQRRALKVAGAIGAVRGVPRARMRSGAGAARPRRRARAGAPPRPLPSESDGPPRAGEGAARRIPGATVVDLDAGCCGMAGSFGYAREHFDVSRAIGERRLLPAARGARRPGRCWSRAARRAGTRSPTSPAYTRAASRRELLRVVASTASPRRDPA